MKPVLSLIALTMLAAAPALAQDRPQLTVYAPEYFVSEWGPGPKIETGFEKSCGCDLVWVTGDVLPKLQMEGRTTKADVAIGMTIDETARARATGLFAPHHQDVSSLTLPVKWDDDTFLPFDWSQTAFIYDATRTKNPPKSFAELIDAPEDLKIVIQDPRSSASGLALLLWVKSVYGDKAPEAWEKLTPKVLTVTKDWSESYGLFTKGEADMVLSYTTSPAYHIVAEKDDTKRAAIFPEGHYLLTETAAQLSGAKDPKLAQAFMDYLLSPEFQGMIAEANWSFPAKLPKDQWPQAFRDLPQPEKTLNYPEAEAEALRKPALDEWLAAFVK